MTDEDVLESFRLADSFLPVGSFTASYALEQFVAVDRITDADELEALLGTYLRELLGRGELVALRAAHRGAAGGDVDTVCRADRRLAAITLPAEFRESATQTGERLLALETDLADDPVLAAYADRVPGEAPGMYPAVSGAVAARRGVPVREACLVHCHGLVTGLLGAAQRLLSFGHTDAQRVLTDLQPTMREAVAVSEGRPLDRMAPFAPLVDVAAAEHERAERRLFMS